MPQQFDVGQPVTGPTTDTRAHEQRSCGSRDGGHSQRQLLDSRSLRWIYLLPLVNGQPLNNLGKGTKNSVYVVVSWSQAFSDLLYQAEYALTIAHSGGFCLQDKHPLIEYFRSISLPLTLSSDQEQNSTEIRIQALESDNIGLNFSSVIYWLCDLG